MAALICENSPTAEILSQGEEIIAGTVVDSNAAWLAQELVALGLDVTRHTALGDRLDDLVESLSAIADRADCCLCTGGLGPTVDDLTAEAAARAFGRPLRLDTEALTAIRAWFARRGAPMPESNCKQAWLPAGATRLDNPRGTAPGFALRSGRCQFFFLPGVPWEMRGLFTETVRPWIKRLFRPRPPWHIVLRTVGLGESTLQDRLDGLSLPPAARLGFCLVGAEVHIKLHLPADFTKKALRALINDLQTALGDAVFSVAGPDGDGGDLPTVTGHLLARRHATLVIAETVSGGILAAQTAALDSLQECRVYPHNRALANALRLPPSLSGEPLAASAARHLLQISGANHALVQITQEAHENALLVFLLSPSGQRVHTRALGDEPNRWRFIAAASALDTLRRHLLETG